MPKDVVLDLGCGFGTITHNLSLIAGKVVGVDRNPFAIESARRHYVRDNLCFVEDDAMNYLNTSGEKFDVLVLTHVLEHIDDPKEFLASYSGRFRRIFIEVPDFDRNNLNHFRLDLNLAQIYTDEDHVTEFDRDEFISLIDDLGLKVLDKEYRYGVQKYWIGCD